MPILTPAYPAMNSTYNVYPSTKEAMLTEFEKGFTITNAILKRDNLALSWKRLFKPFPFFKAFSHYIMIVLCSENGDLHMRWNGFVESKLRLFINALEKLTAQKTYSLEFRPWPKSYENIASTLTQIDEDSSYTKSDTYFIGIRVKKNETTERATVDLT